MEQNFKNNLLFYCVGFLVCIGFFIPEFSGVPERALAANQFARQIEISAYIVNKKNVEFANGQYDVRFAIYTSDRDGLGSAEGVAIWQESQRIEIKNGVFNIYLGSVVPLPEDIDFSQESYYLGVRIGEDSEMVPRKKIGSVSLAINALNAASLSGAVIGEEEGNVPILGNGGTFDETLLPEITSLGTVDAGTWEADPVSLAYGGTGNSHIGLPGAVAYSDGSKYAFTGQGTAGQVLVSGGTGTPTWGGVSGGLIVTDSLNFTEFSDSLLLDADTNIDTNGFALGIVGNFDLNFSQGSLVFQGVSGLAEDNANFFWDDTNNRLGIGDTTPDHILDVAGNIGLDASSYINFGDTDGETGYGLRDNAGTIEYKNSTGAWAGFGGGMSIGGAITSATQGSVLFAGASGSLAQDNDNFFWDDTNDYLGIGTSSPLYRLSIGSVDGTDQIGIYHDNIDAFVRWNAGVLNLQTDEGTDTTSQVYIMGKGTGEGRIDVMDGSWNNGFMAYTQGGNVIVGDWYTNIQFSGDGSMSFGGGQMYLDADYIKVGVGTTAPGYKFSIASDDATDQIGFYHDNNDSYMKWTDGMLVLQTDEGTNTQTYVGVAGKGTGEGRLDVSNSTWSNVFSAIATSAGIVTAGDYYTNIRFGGDGSMNLGYDQLYLDTDYIKVGVGTTSPDYKFSVASADGVDQVGLFYDNPWGSNLPFLKWTSGQLFLQSSEAGAGSKVSLMTSDGSYGFDLDMQNTGNAVIADWYGNSLSLNGNSSAAFTSVGGMNLTFDNPTYSTTFDVGNGITLTDWNGNSIITDVYGIHYDRFGFAIDINSMDWYFNLPTAGTRMGIGTDSPTASLHLPAGTATAGTAPLKLMSGTNLTTPEAGAIEFDGNNLYITQATGPTRKTVAYLDSAITGTFDGINFTTGTQGGLGYFSSTTQLSSTVAGTTGQALISGGTGTPTWFAPTQGSVVFAGANGILSQDNTKLYWDDANDSLGLRTTSTNATFPIMIGGKIGTTGMGGSIYIGNGGVGNGDDLTSNNNIGIGEGALNMNVAGDYNVAIGTWAMVTMNGAARSVAIGAQSSPNGSNSVAIGYQSLYNESAANSIAIGYGAGYNSGGSLSGANNLLVGYQAGNNLTTGTNNIIIGYDVDAQLATGSSQLSIGNLIFGTGGFGTGTTVGIGNIGIGDASPDHKLDVAGNIGLDASSYINFGDTDGETGYGLRDNAGTIEYKNSAGAWTGFGGGAQTPWTSNINAAGYTLYGNSIAGGNLTLSSTSDVTKGKIYFSSTSYFDEASNGFYLIREGAASIFRNYTYADNATSSPYYFNYKARGTVALPSAVLANDRLLWFGAGGHNGTGFSSGAVASLSMYAAENFGATSNGTYVTFGTTPNATTTLTERMRIDQNGYVGIGDTTPASLLTVGSGDLFQVGDVGNLSLVGDIVAGNQSVTGWTDYGYMEILTDYATDTSSHYTALQVRDSETTGPKGGSFIGIRARGTAAAPSAVLADDMLATFAARGYDGTDWNTTGVSRAGVEMHAAGNWSGTDNSTYISFNTTTTASTIATERMRIGHDGTITFSALADGSLSIVGGVVTSSSDERKKDKVADIDSVLGKVMKLDPLIYTWKDSTPEGQAAPDKEQIGFFAQNMEEYFPQLVGTNNEGMKGLNYNGYTAILTKAIQEQQASIEAISNDQSSISNEFSMINDQMMLDGGRITNLETLVQTLETQVAELQAQIATPVDIAQIDLNTQDISYLKTLLGIDPENPSNITLTGQLAAEGVETGKITIKIIDTESPTIGTEIINAGDVEITVLTKAVTADSKIFAAPITDDPVAWAISEKKEGESFTIKLGSPSGSDISFDWWIVEEGN